MVTKDSSNVVSLRGTGIPLPPNEPAANVVDRCRQLLAMAESGQLRGIAVACAVRGEKPRFYWSYDNASSTWHVLSTALMALQHGWMDDNISPGTEDPVDVPPPPDDIA